jgi:secreted PhoX family phosphatase
MCRLAFDDNGDLVVGDDGPYEAHEQTPTGERLPVDDIRGDDSVAPLAEAPDGDVVIGTGRGRDGYEWLAPTSSLPRLTNAGGLGVQGSVINGALGGRNTFRCSDGIAVSTAGDVFFDTDVGNTFTGVSAIVEVTPSRHARAIWKS